MQVFALVERLDEPLVTGEVRHDAHLDLRVVGREKRLERRAVAVFPRTNAERISRPTAVLTGMFCRFGSLDEMRPVLVPVWS